MAARVSAFIVWALVAAGVAFWGLRIFVRPAPVPPHATPVSTTQTARGEVVRVFADPQAAAPVAAQPALASRFKLIGVMAPKPGDSRPGGVALIAVDDKPPRAFVVGSLLDTNLALQTVSMRSASIGSPQGGAPPAVVLELPQLPPPATGTLPPAGSGVSQSPSQSGGPPPPAQAPLTPPPTPAPPPPMMQQPQGAMPPVQGSGVNAGRPPRHLQR